MARKSNGGTRKKAPSGKAAAHDASTVTPIDKGRQKDNGSILQHTEEGIREEIRLRAYQLFEERGRHEGLDHEDWVRAEAEIRAKYQKDKSA